MLLCYTINRPSFKSHLASWSTLSNWHCIQGVPKEVILIILAVTLFALAVKILQGSAVTQTMLGGLTIYLPVANFL